MATSKGFVSTAPVDAPPVTNDLPPPYSTVVTDPNYSYFTTPPHSIPQPTVGVFSHSPIINAQPKAESFAAVSCVVDGHGNVLPPSDGNGPPTSCFHCGKTSKHAPLVACSVCVSACAMTVMCAVCCCFTGC